jgi:polyisoprenoid-binding protein YceI
MAAWLAGPGALAAGDCRVVPEESHVDVEVGTGGLFKFAGHEHVVRVPVHAGRVVANDRDIAASSVRLSFETGGIRVQSSQGPASDIPKVQERMRGADVLDVAAFPQAEFVSSRIAPVGPAGGPRRLLVEGDLTLRGKARRLGIEVEVQTSGGRLVAEGRFRLRQTDFGIRPVSVAGVVKVKDELDLALHVTATCED